MNVIVRVSAPVYPTENMEKVKTAILNIFPVELNAEDAKESKLPEKMNC